MRTLINILVAAFEKRLAARITVGDGPIAHVLAKRYGPSSNGELTLDPTIIVRQVFTDGVDKEQGANCPHCAGPTAEWSFLESNFGRWSCLGCQASGQLRPPHEPEDSAVEQQPTVNPSGEGAKPPADPLSDEQIEQVEAAIADRLDRSSGPLARALENRLSGYVRDRTAR